MGRYTPGRILATWQRWLPVLILAFATGCLRDGAFRQVLGENMLLTVATTIQTVTWVIFNSLLGLI